MAKHIQSRLALALTIAACAAGVVLLAITIAAGDIASAAGLAFTVLVFAVGAAIGDGAPAKRTVSEPEGGEMDRRKDFDDWVREHSRALHGIAYFLSRDFHTAEELVNDALVALWQRWDVVEDRRAFAMRVIRNRHVSFFRKWRRRASEVEWDDAHSTAYEAAVDSLRFEALARAMQRLPRAQREVLLVRYWLDQNQEQTAELLGIPVGTVKSRETRAKKRLGFTVPEEIARVVLKHLEG